MRSPNSVEVGLDLKVFSIKGTWEPNDAERRAAWELYVELVTRSGVVPLRDGIAREALSSLYALFGEAREILRRYGPEVAEPKPDGQYSLGFLTVAMLNFTVRPLLSYWHPELQAWEAIRPAAVSVKAHEDAWHLINDLRAELDRASAALSRYSAILAAATGVPDLSTAIPARVAGPGPGAGA
jgi:hypothetical protein